MASSGHGSEDMFVMSAITKFVNFLRAGYPAGVPATDTFPVLAVLPHSPSVRNAEATA